MASVYKRLVYPETELNGAISRFARKYIYILLSSTYTVVINTKIPYPSSIILKPSKCLEPRPVIRHLKRANLRLTCHATPPTSCLRPSSPLCLLSRCPSQLPVFRSATSRTSFHHPRRIPLPLTMCYWRRRMPKEPLSQVSFCCFYCRPLTSLQSNIPARSINKRPLELSCMLILF